MTSRENENVPESMSHLFLGQGLKRQGFDTSELLGGHFKVIWRPHQLLLLLLCSSDAQRRVLSLARAQRAVTMHDADNMRPHSRSLLYSRELCETSGP